METRFPFAGDGGAHARVLVVDDDPDMRRLIVNYLVENDLRAVAAQGRQEMSAEFTLDEPNLVLLDLRLGQDDGFDLLRDIRSHSDVPVIIATGHRRDEVDRVVGLELGADDYLIKPFGLRELLARIRAVLRRHETRRAPTPQDAAQGRLRFGDWRLDRRNRRLTGLDGAPVALTKGEYALLTAFLDAPQRALSREHLLQATRIHEDIFDRSIDVQVLRLRRRLEVDPSSPRIIRTERELATCSASRWSGHEHAPRPRLSVTIGWWRGAGRLREGVRPARLAGRGRRSYSRRFPGAWPPQRARIRPPYTWPKLTETR